MNKYTVVRGSESQTLEFDIFDSSSTVGARLSGVAFGDITAYYYRQNAAGETAITLATMTLGTWASGGFIEIDATNMPGHYQLSLPNAALATATGVDRVTVELKGAANMVPVTLSIALVDTLTLGTDNKVLISTDAQDLSSTLDVNAKTFETGLDLTTAMKDSIKVETDASASTVLITQMTESYAADGVAPTAAQALFLIQQVLTEFAITGTSYETKKLDGTTTAATMTLNDSSNPTGSTRSS